MSQTKTTAQIGLLSDLGALEHLENYLRSYNFLFHIFKILFRNESLILQLLPFE